MSETGNRVDHQSRNRLCRLPLMTPRPFRTGPVRTVSDVEKATSAWVYWYNTARLMHRLGASRRRVRGQALRCTPCRSTGRTQTTVCA
ncbi:conserved hypothetical protein (plasmid) [Rhodococcus jostii RHA1]|uniref:Uncharacterized protein n=1 Tax=Rhodococcus jostii (strain RHA1) TaxID=101510 RepID=Q0RVY6_RHOJR|nr:conserved hypothetical protein [Rhodococcus jostii RHA1]